MGFSSQEFRDALGNFATGVCVLTACPPGGQAFGMTINSFASVSLQPPLILWSLQNDSELFASWQDTTHYAVNILCAEQRDLAAQYARKGEHALAAAHYRRTPAGVPVLPAALLSLECTAEARHPAGDHHILVARVCAMLPGKAGEPLVFCAGDYRQLAPREGAAEP